MTKSIVVAALTCLSIAPATAGSLTLKNCSGSPIWAGTFNSNDGFGLIPYKSACIQPKQSATLNCATTSCQLAVHPGKCVQLQPDGLGTFISGVYSYASKFSFYIGTAC